MPSCALLPVLALAIVLIPAGAPAGTLSVEFDFTGSTLSLVGGVLAAPPQGGFVAASTVVALPAAGPTTVSPGAASLRSFSATVGIYGYVGGVAFIQGSFRFSQIGTATGSLTPALGKAIFNGGLFVVERVALTCTGFCGLFPPPTVYTLNDVLATLSLSLGGLSANGSATFAASATPMPNSLLTKLTLAGTEVSRTFVPESTHAVQLVVGVAALAGASRLRSRRR